MSHHRQKQRKARLEKVRHWLDSFGPIEVITLSMSEFSCTREKAIEYIAEVTRE